MFPLLTLALLAPAADPAPAPPPNTWVKISPLPGGPPSPGLGYEGALAWDSKHRRVIRFAGHNQGGGGEQNAETWTFDPVTAKWELKEPNTSPPGACCNQQNLFDPAAGRFLRFPAFSGSHGWQWFREIYFSNSSAWTYDLASNTWRDARPLPAPRVAPLRCASWDSDFQVAVVFGGEGSNEGTLAYDPHANTWHRLKPKEEPEPRSGGNMAYDPVNKLHVMFGTQFGNDPATWTFDLRKNQWRGHTPKPSPPTDRNDPVLAYDAASGKVLAVVRRLADPKKDDAGGQVETWSFDAAAKTWARLNPPREPDGWSNRSRVMLAAPELNLTLLESVVNPSQRVKGVDREQQVWVLRTGEAKPPAVLSPVNVRVVTDPAAAMVEWDRSPSTGVAKYLVFRGTGPTPWQAEYRQVAVHNGEEKEFRFRDPDAGNRPVYYRVKSVSAAGQESDFSPAVRAQPRAPDDLAAGVISEKQVRLTWKPAADAAGYVVERAPVEVYTEDQIQRLRKDTAPLAEPSVGAVHRVGKFERLTKQPAAETTFADTGIDLTKPAAGSFDGAEVVRRFPPDQLDPAGKAYRFAVYAYRVRAANGLGVEGGPSAWVLTIPAAPEHVFAKEDGTTCHLKWKAADGVAGYRVYRMEGPKLNGPGQKVTRLTADPLREAKFTDPAATKETKRYWVVAVDALGQEGIPSAPAWSHRQFLSVYRNFTGEWHQ